jgi:hypothetical protein
MSQQLPIQFVFDGLLVSAFTGHFALISGKITPNYTL